MKRVPVLVALSYLIMVTVNALANILPIAGMNTGAVSDSYPTCSHGRHHLLHLGCHLPVARLAYALPVHQ